MAVSGLILVVPPTAVTKGPDKRVTRQCRRQPPTKHKLDANGRLTRGWEYRLKLGHVPSIVRLTIPTSNTPIPAAKQHTASTDTELGEKRANSGGVVAWDGLLVLSIRGRDCLGNRLLEGDVFEPIDVRFVRVICLIASKAMEDWQGHRRTWNEVVGNKRRGSSGTGRGRSVRESRRSRAHARSKRWESAKTDRRCTGCPDLPTPKETAPDM